MACGMPGVRTSNSAGQCGVCAGRGVLSQLLLFFTNKIPAMAIEKTVWPRAPFPEDLKTHPLLIIDYGKIASGDLSEVDRLYEGKSAERRNCCTG